MIKWRFIKFGLIFKNFPFYSHCALPSDTFGKIILNLYFLNCWVYFYKNRSVFKLLHYDWIEVKTTVATKMRQIWPPRGWKKTRDSEIWTDQFLCKIIHHNMHFFFNKMCSIRDVRENYRYKFDTFWEFGS